MTRMAADFPLRKGKRQRGGADCAQKTQTTQRTQKIFADRAKFQVLLCEDVSRAIFTFHGLAALRLCVSFFLARRIREGDPRKRARCFYLITVCADRRLR
jgi:hypothetical protein